MTNVVKKVKLDDVQTHIEESFSFINKHLPAHYVSLVQERMKESNLIVPSAGAIRNVRSRAAFDKKYQNLTIVKFLLEVAASNKSILNKDIEDMRKTLSDADAE